MKSKYWIIILAIFILWSAVRSQDGITDTVYDSILGQVNALYGTGIFRSISGINIDTMTNKGCPTDEHIIFEDPYGTLSGCVVFAATPARVYGQSSPKGFVGVYKNGNIIWHSDTLIDCSTLNGGGIKCTMDLLNDGKADIISSWDEGNGDIVDYLWIFSWDGSTGTLISDTSAPGISSLVSYSDYVNVLDTDGDGVWEIEGRWPDQDSIVVVRWDGQRYVNSPDKTVPSYPPRNKASGTIRTRVSTVDNKFHYQYLVYNFPTSVQKIDRLYLAYDGDFTLTDATGRIGWNLDYYKGHLIGWLNPSTCLIKRGAADSSFSYNSPYPPCTANSYIQGENYCLHAPPYDSSGWTQDILTNSLVKPALSPHLWGTPFNGFNFLDSLKSYVVQSRSLGWITSQSSADTYQRFIDTAKAQLQRNDSLSARRALDSVMQHAVADSASVLTSEAFALIFFNAQYLLAQMPPAPSHHTITATAGPNGSISPRGDNTVNDGESITIIISPNPGFHIAGVFIDNANTSVGTDSTYTFKNVTADHQISASFAANQYVITSLAIRNGSISPSGAVSVSFDSSQTFIFTPDNCCFIDSVIVDGAAQVPPPLRYTFTGVTANHSIKAIFAIHIDTIKAFAGPHGSISPEGTVLVNCGLRQTFIITPANCYRVTRLIVDGAQRDSTASYTFDDISANHAIRAVFAVDYDTIMASVGRTDGLAHGTIKPSGTVVVACGANRTFRMKPNTGYTIQNVVVDGIDQGPLNRYTFSHVTSRHAITAYFAVKKYVITASAGAGGTISPDGKVEVNYGFNQSFTITPNSGYAVRSVVVDGVSRGAISTYTFTRVAANHTLSASFSKRGH